MANSTNPFDEISEIDDISAKEPNLNKENVALPHNNDSFTFEAIALKLIKDNLFLSALELHTELVESGREIPRLRDYFSNPANFERTKLDAFAPALRKFTICFSKFTVHVTSYG